MKKQSLIYRIPFYLIFLGIYPVVFLWLVNFHQVPWYVIQRPLIFSLGLTASVTLISLLILRNLRKAALVAGLFIFFFFFYGHFYDLFEGWKAFGFLLGRHLITYPLWASLFLIGLFTILRSKSQYLSLTWALNLILGALVLFNFVELGYFSLSSREADHPEKLKGEINTSALPAALPDVYYLLSDAYDREDLLESDEGLDNSQFIAQLEKLGFSIPDCTQSNYNTTVSSMAATLNMNYLDALGHTYQELAPLVDTENFTTQLEPLSLNNRVIPFFTSLGYQIITLKTVYLFVNFPDSDIVYDFQSGSGSMQKIESSNFQYLYMRTTWLRVLVEEMTSSPNLFKTLPDGLISFIDPQFSRYNGFYYQTAQQNLYQLDKLETVAQVLGRKFVYAHLLVTHPPFTFTATGDLRLDMNQSDQAYADQITYANQRYLKIIENILVQSKTPPIIILQGDHAYGWDRKGKDAFKIINAYYLPGKGNQAIYPTITPVNTFRVILSQYFGQNLPLLPDQSIWINSRFAGGYEVVPPVCVH